MVRYASRGTTIQQPDGSTIIVGNTAAEPVSKTDSDYAATATTIPSSSVSVTSQI